MGVQVVELRALDGEALDRWALLLGDALYGFVARSEAVANRVADLLEKTVTIGMGSRVREWAYFWEERDDGKGGKLTMIGEEDNDLKRAQKQVEKEISEQLGFDPDKDCPEMSLRHGWCSGCLHLEWDGEARRFSCCLRKCVVDTLRTIEETDDA